MRANRGSLGTAIGVTAVAAALAAVALRADAADRSAVDHRPGERGPAAACAHTATPVAELKTRQLRRALRCSLNRLRKERRVRRLLRSPQLQRAAQRHTRVMVRRNCLGHRCGREPDLETRIRRTGYLRNATRWRFAENTGCAISAEAMARSWVSRTFHRRNIHDEELREVGIGVMHETPRMCEEGHATFTAVFGWRQR